MTGIEYLRALLLYKFFAFLVVFSGRIQASLLLRKRFRARNDVFKNVVFPKEILIFNNKKDSSAKS